MQEIFKIRGKEVRSWSFRVGARRGGPEAIGLPRSPILFCGGACPTSPASIDTVSA